MIVMANELDRTSEQTAAGINILLPDVMSEFCRPAIAGERTSQGQAVPDPDW